MPKYALEALRPLLEIWERCGASCRRLRESPLTKDQLDTVSHRFLPCIPKHILLAIGYGHSAPSFIIMCTGLDRKGCCEQVEAAASRMCNALPHAPAPSSTAAGLYPDFIQMGSSATLAKGPNAKEAAARGAISEEVADMAASWTQLLAAGPASGLIASFGLAGVAASVLVAACPRCEAIRWLHTEKHLWRAFFSIWVGMAPFLFKCAGSLLTHFDTHAKHYSKHVLVSV